MITGMDSKPPEMVLLSHICFLLMTSSSLPKLQQRTTSPSKEFWIPSAISLAKRSTTQIPEFSSPIRLTLEILRGWKMNFKYPLPRILGNT